MSKVTVSYSSPVFLNISSCQDVLLCLGGDWGTRTVSGKKYIVATVENSGRNLGGSEVELEDMTPWENPRGSDFFQYSFTYDDSQLLEGEVVKCSDVQDVFSACLETILGSGTSESPSSPTVDLTVGERLSFTSPSHGLGGNNSIVALQGNYAKAKADDPNTTADLLGVVTTSNTFEILSPGIHRIASHGLTVGAWYALSTTLAGGYVLSTSITQDQIRQNLFLPLSTDYIYVEPQEASLARVIPAANKITKSSHGFVVGNRVGLNAGVWGPAQAGEVGHFVKEVLDANTFVIGFAWSGTISGLVAGTTYAIDPAVPGALIDVTLLDPSTDPITRVGFSPLNNYLLGFFEYPVIVGSGITDVVAPTVSSALVPPAGTTIVLTLSEVIIPTSGITGFTAKIGATNNPIISATRTASNKITLTLTNTVQNGDTVTYSYSGGNVTDNATNALATITNAATTNTSTQGIDVTVPTVVSASVPSAGTTLILSMSETVIPTSGITGFTTKLNGVANTIVSATRTAAAEITLTLTDVVEIGDVVLYSYSAGNVTDAATNALSTITDASATNSSTQGSGGGETLIWDESFEGGTHEETYSNGYNIVSQNSLLVNNSAVATDGNYYNPYTAAAGVSSFNTYYARGALPGAYVHLRQELDIQFVHIAPLTTNDGLLVLREATSGSWLGFMARIILDEANHGFFLSYDNNKPGETLSGADTLGVGHPALVVGNWYRVTLNALMNTATNSNDAVLKWKVENLSSGSSPKTVTSDFIAERTVSINSHAGVSPVGFNEAFGLGGSFQTSQARTANWGLNYDRYKIYSIT